MNVHLFRLSATRLLAWILVSTAPTGLLSGLDSTPEWTTDLGSNTQWVESTPFGELIVATRDGLIGLNPESGQPLWYWGDAQTLRDVTLSPLPGSPFYRINYPGGIKVLDPAQAKFSSTRSTLESIRSRKPISFSN